MKSKYKIIGRDDFFSESKVVLNYYDNLPSDNYKIEPCALDFCDFDEIVSKLLIEDIFSIELNELDEFAMLLYNEYDDIEIDEQLFLLANKFSECYSYLLFGNKSNRNLRMKLQQLNFFIRDVLDKNILVNNVSDFLMQVKSPWDLLRTDFGEVLITSEKKNLIIKKNNKYEYWTCGFPSQLDILSPKYISIGSIFSNGGWVYNGMEPLFVSHHAPIVLFFEDKFVDYKGEVFDRINKTKLLSIKVNEVSKARIINGIMYVFDWTTTKRIYTLNLLSNIQSCIKLPDILIGNDICFHKDSFYIVDKQQGYVFKYSIDFILISKKLGFGKGLGKLYDPISIRENNGELCILSWLSNKSTTLKAF